MGVAVFFVLTVVVVLLLCTPRGERGLALGLLLAVGVALWVAVRISLHRLLGSLIDALLTLGWGHRTELLLGFAAAVVLIVPIFMLYVAVGDQLDKRAAASRRRARLSQRGLGFVLQSDQPWIRAIDDEPSNSREAPFRKKQK